MGYAIALPAVKRCGGTVSGTVAASRRVHVSETTRTLLKARALLPGSDVINAATSNQSLRVDEAILSLSSSMLGSSVEIIYKNSLYRLCKEWLGLDNVSGIAFFV